MKGRYILAAATGWSSAGTEPLPAEIPAEKLKEISMIHPPFPPLHQLTYNFLTLPETVTTIRERVELWQNNSRQLAAWIAQARVQSAKLPSCSWNWPSTPTISYHLTPPNNLYSVSPSAPLPKDKTDAEDSSSISTNSGILFKESPKPPSEYPFLGAAMNNRPNSTHPLGRIARAFQAGVKLDSLKRVRDTSPVDTLRDGCDASKKQLVLWKPSLAQLIERQQALTTGEVSSHFTGSRIKPSLHSRDLLPRVSDPRLRISLLTADPTTDTISLTPEPITDVAGLATPEAGDMFGKD